MNNLFQGIAEDFSDLPDMSTVGRASVRLLLAGLLGGVLGFEREIRGKDAGLRTHMLVSLGAAIFVLVPQLASMSDDALSRVIQGVAAGIGFLGAGTILRVRSREDIQGLTTAANIWLTAGIGVAVGLGRASSAILATLLALVVLAIIPRWERSLSLKQRQRSPDLPNSKSPHP